METFGDSRSAVAEISVHCGQTLREHLSNLRKAYDRDASATVEDVLREVRALERRQYAQSRFRRLARCLEPLMNFLMMYSPALDIIVQFDANPSAIIWGSLKALLKVLLNAIGSYRFIEYALAKLADIFSTSVRYQKMFEKDRCVQRALEDLYLEVLLLLQQIRSTICKKSLMLVIEGMFRSIDLKFQDNIQRLSRAHKLFKEEVTFAHRRYVQNQLEEQRLANSTLDQIALQTKGNATSKSEYSTTRSSITQWLDQDDSYGAFRRASKKRAPGTGLWLPQNPHFQYWAQSSNGSCDRSRLLWIHGPPGAGKTVMSSTIIDYIASGEAVNGTVTYSYSKSMEGAHRTAFNICVTALSQLLKHTETLPSVLLERYGAAQQHGRSKICEADEVFDLFEQVSATLPPVFLVIDALDECTEISEVVSWLTNVIQSISSLHVVCLSRDTMAIRKLLGHQPTIRMNATNLKDDIDTYLMSAVNTLPSAEQNLRDRIFDILSRKARGMFLLARLSIETLRGATNEEDVYNVLNAIPDGVNEMYVLILRRLSTESETRRSLAHRVLRLLCFSALTMTWSELRHALSWNEKEQRFQKNREPFKDTVCELCCPLIEYQSETDVFRLAHLSVHDFLCGGFLQSIPSLNVARFFVQEADVHRELASITLACVTDVKVSHQFKIDQDLCPLAAYATKYWCNHLCQSSIDCNLRKRYIDFVTCSEMRSTWILRWLLSEERAFALQQVVKMQKLLQGRMIEHSQQQPSVIDLLNDTQRALFRLDHIQSSSRLPGTPSQIRVISNFERLMCIRDLAREYTMASEIEHGVKMFESALKEANRLGEDISPDSCWLLNSLGILYDQQGKFNLAKLTQHRALSIQEKWLSQDYLDIVITINELGRVARHLSQFSEAEMLHRRALRMLEGLFPDGDLHIVWTQNALGRALLKRNRPDEAMSFHQKALATESDRLGRDHPHTLWTLSDIARCYCAQNDIECAIKTQREVMEKSESVLGVNNADTLWAKNSMGNFHELLGQFDEARELHAEALIGQTTHLGSNHSHTIWSRQALARLGNLVSDHSALPETVD